MKTFLNLILLSILLNIPALSQYCPEPIFHPVKIDGPVHDPVNHTYWYGPYSEISSVLDMDADGDLDIACGKHWFENPHWTKHAFYRDGSEFNGPETDGDSEYVMDVNKDGYTDVVYGGWQFMHGLFWFENPKGKKDVPWESHRIYNIERIMEGFVLDDIDGDGDLDMLVNHYASQEGKGVSWFEHIDEEPWFVNYQLGYEGDEHGNGLGDVDMDGDIDVVTPSGWYEQPEDIYAKWPFHADWKFDSYYHEGVEPDRHGRHASLPIKVFDANQDGLNDIIIGSSHEYGLIWYEQGVSDAGQRYFIKHYAETEFTQFHCLALGDLNGDGQDDLVTGKRLFAHHGGDIGSGEPMYTFWYDMQKGNFKRHLLAYNHLPHFPGEMHNPAPEFIPSIGMSLHIADMDSNGKNDIIFSGKGGLYVFFNYGNPPTGRVRPKLWQENVYPTYQSWGRYKYAFNHEDLSGWIVPKGDKGHWKAEKGRICYDGMSAARGSKNLKTQAAYKDYRLHIEWRVRDESTECGTQSGLLLRGPDGGLVTLGNVCQGSGGLKLGDTEIKPVINADRPLGYWNAMNVYVVNNTVTVLMNGETVIEDAVLGNGNAAPSEIVHQGSIDPATGKVKTGPSPIEFRNILWMPVEGQTTSSGFVTLFDGETLNGWLTGPDNAFIVEDGSITTIREYDGKEHNLDYLWTPEEYENFVLEIEFKVTDNTNSGIFFRTGDLKDPLYTGLEVQVLNSYGKEGLDSKGTAGAIYDVLAPYSNAVKPAGEWNKCQITCQNQLVRVVMNGELIIEMDLDNWDTPNQNYNEVPNKYPTAIKDFPRKGHIGLQDHGRRVWYKNIRVKRL